MEVAMSSGQGEGDREGSGAPGTGGEPAGTAAPVELTVVTLRFDTVDDERLLAALARYVVLTRMHPGCRNVDLCASVSTPHRYLVIEKWETPAAQRAHFDSHDMVEMAGACRGLLAGPPDIELLESVSAHDLR
jgi:quinol monooxygenase YgiN